jgi:hypothetical protein
MTADLPVRNKAAVMAALLRTLMFYGHDHFHHDEVGTLLSLTSPNVE